jgi:hypothetical protein
MTTRARSIAAALLLLGAASAQWAGCGSGATARAATEEPLPAGAKAAPQPTSQRIPAAGHTRPVTPRELRAIQPLIDAAERVRGLRFVHEVPVLVQDPDAIMGYVDGQIKKDELERSRTIYTALGLLSPDLDVRKLLLRLMGEQIVGYYDVEAHHLVVREDVMHAFGGGGGPSVVDLAEAKTNTSGSQPTSTSSATATPTTRSAR